MALAERLLNQSDAVFEQMSQVCLRTKEKLPEKTGPFAFIIHPRDMSDVLLQFPELSNLAGINPERVIKNFKQLEPFVVCNFLGLRGLGDQAGKQLPGFLVCAPFMPFGPKEISSELEPAKQKVIDAARFAKEEFGVKIVGLGEFTAFLTHSGRDIEKRIPGLYATTGHAYTTYLIGETLSEAARKVDADLRKSTLAIVGAAGSIGLTCAQMFKDRVRKLITITHHAETSERLGELNGALGENNDRVFRTGDFRALKEADFIICATTTPEPIIHAGHLKPGTIIIDDSQPPNILREEARAAQSVVLHVVARTPGIQRDFDYGLPAGCDWACAAEVMAVAATSQWEERTRGPVRVENMERMGRLCREVGFRLAPLQSFGRYISEEKFGMLREARENPAPAYGLDQ